MTPTRTCIKKRHAGAVFLSGRHGYFARQSLAKFRDPASLIFSAEKIKLRLGHVRKNPKQLGFFVMSAI